MNLQQLVAHAADKTKFVSTGDYIDFCVRFLEYSRTGVQARIVALNETRYLFYQFKDDGRFPVSRPVNSELIYETADGETIRGEFPRLLKAARELSADARGREVLRRSIYTLQQSIGVTLDASNSPNTARKVAGDLFERLIRLVITDLGIERRSGVIGVPILVQKVELCKMNYQHDLLIRSAEGRLKVIGSVKTSSKDRMDKVFVDKFLYSKLTDTQLPHIAVFLNDVQRKGKHPKYGISSTFLPSRFKGYSIKLNPLDGVYYCDPRPNMATDAFLRSGISTIDKLLCDDIWRLLDRDLPESDLAEPTPIKVVKPGDEAELEQSQ